MMAKLTMQLVRAELDKRAMKIRKLDGEFRVTYGYGTDKFQEDCAYYTTDLEDAFNTGIEMAKHEGH